MRKIVSFLLVTFILLVVGCERAKIDERGLENPIANCEKIISELNDTLSEDKERQEISDSVTQVKPDNKKEIKSCQKNTECMFVPKSCVGMGGVGKPKAINVKFLEYYYKNVLEDCKEFNIGDYLIYLIYPKLSSGGEESAYFFYENHRPICINNKCSIQKVAIQQDVYDCYFKVAVLTDNITLCNQTNNRTGCTYKIAKHSKNPNLCKNILAEFPSCYHDVLCEVNNEMCQLKVKEQIIKDFPEMSKSLGEYGICAYESFGVEVNLILKQEKISKPVPINYAEWRPAGSGGGFGMYSYLQCFITKTDTPLFIIKTNNLVEYKVVDGSEIIDSFYHDGDFHSYNASLTNLNFKNEVPILLIFREDYKKSSFNHEISIEDCQINNTIYDKVLKESTEDLHFCLDIEQYLSKNNFFNLGDRCKDVLKNNLRIKCIDNYALNNKRFDLCITLNCKIKTAKNLEACKDIYHNTEAEQAACKQVIGFELAQKTLDEKYCSYIPLIYSDFEQCVSNIASKKIDKKICLLLPKDSRRFSCYGSVASLERKNNKKGISISELESTDNCEGYSSTDWRRTKCYLYNAIITKNISYCTTLGIGDNAFKCYSDVAIINNDPTLCKKADRFKDECEKLFG